MDDENNQKDQPQETTEEPKKEPSVQEQEPKVLRVEKGSELTAAELQEVTVGRYWTIKQLADKLAYSNTWVTGLCQSGRIKAVKPFGGYWRIPQSEIDRIMQHGIPSPPKEASPEIIEQPINVPETVTERITKQEEERKKVEKKFPWSLFDL